MPRRSGGGLAIIVLIFALLIGEAAAYGLGDYTSVTDALTLIASIMSWSYLVNAASHHLPFVERLVSPRPIQVIINGRLLRRNMRSELLAEQELTSYLREQGIDDLSSVKATFIEGEPNQPYSEIARA